MVRVVAFCLALVLASMGVICGAVAFLSLLATGLVFWILSLGGVDTLTLMAAIAFAGVGLLAGLVAVALCGAALESMDHALSPFLPA
jgi:hypothetical protein